VTDVTSQEVSSAVLSGDGTTKIVLLYATWCEHCRIMMPAYNAAAESTRQIRWLKVEQTNAGPILKARSDIRGFPTIFGIKQNGEIVQYGERDPRTEESLRKWALQLHEPIQIEEKVKMQEVSGPAPAPVPVPVEAPVQQAPVQQEQVKTEPTEVVEVEVLI